MSTVRQEAIKAIATTKHKLDRIDFKTTHVAELFGVNVFNEVQQRARLPKPIFKSLQKTIKEGAPLDPGDRRRRGNRDERLGDGEGRDPLHAHLPADDRHHRREA